MLFFLFCLCIFYTIDPGLIGPVVPDLCFVPERCVPSRVHGVGLLAAYGISGGRMAFPRGVRFITCNTFPPGTSIRTGKEH